MEIRDLQHIRETSLQSKGELRKSILALRDRMQAVEKACFDRKIRERVFEHPVYLEAQVILAYASYRSEVDTMELIRQALQDGKAVFVPKVAKEEMEFWRILSTEDLRSGYCGIPEPEPGISLPEWLASGCFSENGGGEGNMECRQEKKGMLWMPGAVFDTERHRIGYGKGYYDRYLDRFSEKRKETDDSGCRLRLTTAALAYACQILSGIPYETHDVRPDMIISEQGILSAAGWENQ